MANITREKMIDLVPQSPALWRVHPIQDDDVCYQGLLGTLDASHQVGTYSATERLAGMIRQTVKNNDENHAASRLGYEVSVLFDAFLRWKLSGSGYVDVGRAVFGGGDNQTLSFTPKAKQYFGQILAHEGSNNIAVIHMTNVGVSSYETWFTLADNGEQVLAAEPGIAIVQGGGKFGVVSIAANGAVAIATYQASPAVAGTISANFAISDAGASLCVVDVGGVPTLINNLGATTRVHVKFIAAPAA